MVITRCPCISSKAICIHTAQKFQGLQQRLLMNQFRSYTIVIQNTNKKYDAITMHK